MADFGGEERNAAVGFSIENKGYIGTGHSDGETLKDFWEFDPAKNLWERKADFGGVSRSRATAFSINNKGYIGIGGDFFGGLTIYDDFWEYNPQNNIWIKKAHFADKRLDAVGFSIAKEGYVGGGAAFSSGTAIHKNDLWFYNPSTDKWTKKQIFPGSHGGMPLDLALLIRDMLDLVLVEIR